MQAELPHHQMVTVPDGALDLGEVLLGPEVAYKVSHKCSGCEHTLYISTVKVDWPTEGPRHYYFGPLPGYECKDCSITYLPENVLEFVKQTTNEEFANTNPSDTLQVPQNVKVAIGAFVDRQ